MIMPRLEDICLHTIAKIVVKYRENHGMPSIESIVNDGDEKEKGPEGEKGQSKDEEAERVKVLMERALAHEIPTQFVTRVEFCMSELDSGRGNYQCLWCKNTRFSNHARVEKFKWIAKPLRRSSRRSYSRRSGSSSDSSSIHLPLKHRYCSVSCALWDL